MPGSLDGAPCWRVWAPNHSAVLVELVDGVNFRQGCPAEFLS